MIQICMDCNHHFYYRLVPATPAASMSMATAWIWNRSPMSISEWTSAFHDQLHFLKASRCAGLSTLRDKNPIKQNLKKDFFTAFHRRPAAYQQLLNKYIGSYILKYISNRRKVKTKFIFLLKITVFHAKLNVIFYFLHFSQNDDSLNSFRSGKKQCSDCSISFNGIGRPYVATIRKLKFVRIFMTMNAHCLEI